MIIEDEIVRFTMQLLRKMPFYGDIIMRLPIVRNDAISTARTDGRSIEYNGKFLSGMSVGQRNFIIMHEVFHVLLCVFYFRANVLEFLLSLLQILFSLGDSLLGLGFLALHLREFIIALRVL